MSVKYRLADTHCHIVPGVDDGAADLSVARAMCEEAAAIGIEAILTTPHVASRRDDIEKQQWHQEVFDTQLRDIEKPALYLGCEVRVTSDAMDVIGENIFTANGAGKYVLLEMPTPEIPQITSRVIFEYRMRGVRPIIAHPERNFAIIRKPEIALDFVRQGALLQVTTTSISGELGESIQACSRLLYETGLIAIVASDAHNVTSRVFSSWLPALTTLEAWRSETGGSAIEPIVFDNPLAVCEGRDVPLNDSGGMDDEIRRRLQSVAGRSGQKRKRFIFF